MERITVGLMREKNKNQNQVKYNRYPNEPLGLEFAA